MDETRSICRNPSIHTHTQHDIKRTYKTTLAEWGFRRVYMYIPTWKRGTILVQTWGEGPVTKVLRRYSHHTTNHPSRELERRNPTKKQSTCCSSLSAHHQGPKTTQAGGMGPWFGLRFWGGAKKCARPKRAVFRHKNDFFGRSEVRDTTQKKVAVASHF